MATLRVEYEVIMVQVIEWPDDEIDSLSYENLVCNLSIENSSEVEITDITDLKKDGKPYYF